MLLLLPGRETLPARSPGCEGKRCAQQSAHLLSLTPGDLGQVSVHLWVGFHLCETEMPPLGKEGGSVGKRVVCKHRVSA